MKSQVMRLILIIVALFSVSLWGQDTWVKTYTPFEEEWVEGIGWIEFDVTYDVEDILVTQDGGFLVSGAIDRTIDDDPPHWWDHWGFLMKTDCDGNLLWADADSVSFMGENDNYAVVETVEGDLISSGRYYFGGGYMIKRDAEGNRIWAVPYEGIGVFSMDTTSDGNIILGGRSDYNPALRKITPDAETIWTSIIDTDSGIAFSVTQASDGGYLMTGVNYGDNDILVIKTDTNGDSLWTRTYEGLGGNDQGNCVINTNNGDILLCGWLFNVDINEYHALLWKLEQSGNTVWCNIYNDSTIYYFISVIQSIDSNYVAKCNKLTKIDEQQNIMWNEEVTGSQNAMGDRSIQEIEDGGFVCVTSNLWTIIINRTDENGQVDNDDNTLEILSTQLYNFPNPFNPATTINYNLGLGVRNPNLEIYNIKGQRVNELKIDPPSLYYGATGNEGLRTGSVVWDGSGFASGIYFYRIRGENYISEARKMILMK